jgi:hypothetical protein
MYKFPELLGRPSYVPCVFLHSIEEVTKKFIKPELLNAQLSQKNREKLQDTFSQEKNFRLKVKPLCRICTKKSNLNYICKYIETTLTNPNSMRENIKSSQNSGKSTTIRSRTVAFHFLVNHKD